MQKYGKILFKVGLKEGAALQKKIIEEMNRVKIITVDQDTINRWYAEDAMNPAGAIHTYVLHDEGEENTFREFMESSEMQSDRIKWKITDRDDDPEFLAWSNDVELREDEYFQGEC